jgi:hypothetical protein
MSFVNPGLRDWFLFWNPSRQFSIEERVSPISFDQAQDEGFMNASSDSGYRTMLSAEEPRQGVTGHALIFGVGAVIIAFAALYVGYFV